MAISKDRVTPSWSPDSWKLKEIFATGVVIGAYLALATVLFYWAVTRTTFFEVGRAETEHPRLQSHFSLLMLSDL